jgi:phosphoribosylcarboxyaminoimidazole (NCAIR) mutase
LTMIPFTEADVQSWCGATAFGREGPVPRLQSLAEIYTTDAVCHLISKPKSTPKATVEAGNDMNGLEIGFHLDGVEEQELRNILRSLMEKKYHKF